jgi:hypothetical protein
VRKHFLNSFAADAENVHRLLEDRHSPVLVCFVLHSVSVASSLFRIVSHFFQAVSVIRTDLPHKDLGGQRPRPTTRYPKIVIAM